MEEANRMAGLQLESRETGFEITTNISTNHNISMVDVDSQSAHNTAWLKGFETSVAGMGGEFSESSPRSRSPNLLWDFSIDNDQQSPHDFGILDEFFKNDSTSISALPSVTMGEFDNTSNFVFDLNPHPSIVTPSEVDVWLNASSESVAVISSQTPSTGDIGSTPSDSLQDFGSYLLSPTEFRASEVNGPSNSTTSDLAPPLSTPFSCDVEGCSRSYRRVHELRRHIRVHSNTRPHACRFSSCRRSGQNGFTRKDHLKQHLRQAHQASL